MAVGTAIAVGMVASAAASAGASAYAANKQSSAAKKAADVQERAAREAQQRGDRMFGQQTQLLSPYLNAGAHAMTTLSRLMGAPAGSMYASGPPPNAPGLTLPQDGGAQAMPRGRGIPASRAPVQLGQFGGSPATPPPPSGPPMTMTGVPAGPPMGGPPPGFRPPAPQGMDPRFGGGGRYLQLADFARAA
jgi:hypothetical protein